MNTHFKPELHPDDQRSCSIPSLMIVVNFINILTLFFFLPSKFIDTILFSTNVLYSKTKQGEIPIKAVIIITLKNVFSFMSCLQNTTYATTIKTTIRWNMNAWTRWRHTVGSQSFSFIYSKLMTLLFCVSSRKMLSLHISH